MAAVKLTTSAEFHFMVPCLPSTPMFVGNCKPYTLIKFSINIPICTSVYICLHLCLCFLRTSLPVHLFTFVGPSLDICLSVCLCVMLHFSAVSSCVAYFSFPFFERPNSFHFILTCLFHLISPLYIHSFGYFTSIDNEHTLLKC